MLSTIQEKTSESIEKIAIATAPAETRVETNRARENRRYLVALGVSVSALLAVVILGISVL